MMAARHWVAVGTMVSVAASAEPARGQGNNPRAVQPERPTVATHAGTVAPGFLEEEWGVEFGPNSALVIPIYFKIGVGERAQLGLLAPIVRPVNGDARLGDVSVALKWRMFEAHPVLGKFAIQPGVTLPTGSGSSGSAASVLLISSRDLGSVALDLNLGITASNGSSSQTVWTLSLGGPLRGRWGWVGEAFGFLSSGSSSTALLFGPTYRVAPAFVIDLGAIVPVDGNAGTRYYVGGVTNTGRIFGR